MSDENVFKFEELEVIEEASQKLIDGKLWGYIYFHQNFSDAFFSRVLDVMNLEGDVMNQSSIQVIFSMFLVDLIYWKGKYDFLNSTKGEKYLLFASILEGLWYAFVNQFCEI